MCMILMFGVVFVWMCLCIERASRRRRRVKVDTGVIALCFSNVCVCVWMGCMLVGIFILSLG